MMYAKDWIRVSTFLMCLDRQEMQKGFLRLFPVLFLGCLSLTAFPEERPALKEYASIHLRSSDGWWLSINGDGSGSYGFGTGMARVEVVTDTFSYEQVYAAIENDFVDKPGNAEEPYMAVAYYREGSGSAFEYRLAQDRDLLFGLFRLARANTRPPASEFELSSYNQVKSFWRHSPWKDGPNVSPNKTNPANPPNC